MATTDLTEAAIGALRERIAGTVITPSDSAYDDARAVWNGTIDRRPALIVRCSGVADVVAALAHAREHDLLIAVRGGGHNVAGTAVCDGGIVIDLSQMRAVSVDPAARGSRAAPPGATSTPPPSATGSSPPAASCRRPASPA